MNVRRRSIILRVPRVPKNYSSIRRAKKEKKKTHFYNIFLSIRESCTHNRDGNGAGRGRAGPKDGVFTPAPHRFFLPHPRPTSHDRENFLSHPRPLRPLEAPPHSVKLYFLLIFPTIITIFSNKMTCFNNKNILEPNKCYKLLSSVHYFFFLLQR